MRKLKGVSEVISSLLIVLVGISLVGTAYIYGLPLIEKRQDTALLDRVRSAFDQNSASSLPSTIENVANLGGSSRFNLDVKGLWQLGPCITLSPSGNYYQGCLQPPVGKEIESNMIQFNFSSKVSDVAIDKGWVSLTPGSACPEDVTKTPTPGILGKDKATIVCEAASTTAQGSHYLIAYRVYFRQLIDPSLTSSFNIELAKDPSTPGNLRSTGTSVQTTFDSRRFGSAGPRTETNTTLKILLVG